jgi:hypothetical protein
MLSSIFKKRLAPQVYEEDRAIDNLEPVEYSIPEEDDSKSSRTLYYRPKLAMPRKIFSPEQWAISNFQIGKHLGRGKYLPPHQDTATSTSPASALASTSWL